MSQQPIEATPDAWCLKADRDGGRLQLHLRRGEELVATHQTEELAEIDSAARDVSRYLAIVWQTNQGSQRHVERLTQAASRLTDVLLGNRALRAALSDPQVKQLHCEAPLALHGIAWEALRPGDGFLGERVGLARVVADLPAQPNADSIDRMAHAEVIVNHSGGLAWGIYEGQIVRAALRQMLRSQGPLRADSPMATFEPLTCEDFLRRLANCDWLHFAGHAVKASARAWLLREATHWEAEELLTPSDVLAATDGDWPRVVVANACGSLELPNSLAHSDSPTMIEALLRRGVQCLIGPTTPVLDAQSRVVIEPLYRELATGVAPVEALRRARGVAAKNGLLGSFLGLSYVMYTARFDAEQSLCSRTRESSDRSLTTSPTEEIPNESVSSRTVDRGADAAPLAKTKIAGAWVADLWRLEQNARVRFFTAVEQLRRWFDPASSAESAVQLQLLREESHGEQVRWESRSRWNATDQSPHPHLWSCCWSVLPESSSRAVQRGSLAEVCWRTLVAESGSQRAARQQPISLSQLLNILAETNPRCDETTSPPRQIWLLASLTGWDQEAVDYMTGENGTSFREAQRSVVLIDVTADQAHYRATDLGVIPILELLKFEEEGEQVHRVIRLIEAQLPLAVSASVSSIAADAGARPSAVATAFRLLKEQHRLQLDDLPGWGLVLSQPVVRIATLNDIG